MAIRPGTLCGGVKAPSVTVHNSNSRASSGCLKCGCFAFKRSFVWTAPIVPHVKSMRLDLSGLVVTDSNGKTVDQDTINGLMQMTCTRCGYVWLEWCCDDQAYRTPEEETTLANINVVHRECHRHKGGGTDCA